jgi:hypothetical protein
VLAFCCVAVGGGSVELVMFIMTLAYRTGCLCLLCSSPGMVGPFLWERDMRMQNQSNIT